MAAQIKRGYLRGCRGLMITELNSNGSTPESPIRVWVDTSQEANVEQEVVEGDSSDLRGGDRLLVRVEDNDVIVGANVDFTDARFNAELLKLIQGGTLLYDSEDTEEVIGWVAPTIAAQTETRAVMAELYVASHNAQGGREAYLKYVFPFCKGLLGAIAHGDKEWGTPEFSLKARENPSTGASAYSKFFVSGIPYAVNVAAVVGGTAVVTTDADEYALSGATVIVTIADIEALLEFKSIVVVDANGTAISTTEVTPGASYSFTMPASAATITVTVGSSE